MKFWVLAAALFLGVVRSTRNILAHWCPCQHIKLVWPQVSLASSILLISVMALQEKTSNRRPQEQTIYPILAHIHK